MGSDCCWCCCCCHKPAAAAPLQPQVLEVPHMHHVAARPVVTTITMQPPAIANITTQPPAVANITTLLPVIATITTQPPAVANITPQPPAYDSITMQPPAIPGIASSPPLIVTENRLRTREPLPIARPTPRPSPDMGPIAPVPTAPPAPMATEHCWTRTRLAHTEPSVMVGEGCYAGRVVAGRDTLPAILETQQVVDFHSGVPVEQFVAAHFFYRNKAGSSEDFEVLSCLKTSWQPAMGGYAAPEDAIVCGRTASGRPLYFGRTFDEGKYHFGTADPEDGLLYSMANGGTWYGCVRTSQHFDILVAA